MVREVVLYLNGVINVNVCYLMAFKPHLKPQLTNNIMLNILY